MRAVAPRALVLALSLAACPARQAQQHTPLADPVAGNDGSLTASMIAELQDDVLTAYERDEPPEIESGMVPAQIGGARIGVGPGDVLIADELERAPSRWPLRVDHETPTEVHSKRLETHLAQDLSAAWVFDELSWRISACGRTTVIPLRITMLYARDGDRWVEVFEHTSYGQPPAPHHDGKLYGTTIPAAVISGDLRDALSRVASPMLFGQIARDPSLVAHGPRGAAAGTRHRRRVARDRCPSRATRARTDHRRGSPDRHRGQEPRDLDDRVLDRQRDRGPPGTSRRGRGQGSPARDAGVREAAVRAAGSCEADESGRPSRGAVVRQRSGGLQVGPRPGAPQPADWRPGARDPRVRHGADLDRARERRAAPGHLRRRQPAAAQGS